MEQRLTVLTIGVDNLTAMREFYEQKFGWTPVAANKDIVFFKLNGFLFSLFGKAGLAQDADVQDGSTGPNSLTLSYIVEAEAEVDALFARLENAGVRIAKRPEKTFFGGYSGYVADIEGNLWGIACNPYIEMDPQGNVITHKDIEHL